MILGVVAEYNPFHNGHLLHLNQSKYITNSKYVIAIMSGNFVQRGEPAICDKYYRTLMALKNGVDLVIELPTFYATASAEYFSFGAISLLDKIGIIDFLSFGSESGDLKALNDITEILLNETDIFKSALKTFLKNGNSYAAARQHAVNTIIGNNIDNLKQSNNILAIEYLKSIKKLNSKIKPVTIKRQIADYNSLVYDRGIASAKAIRHFLFNEKNLNLIKTLMPKYSYDILNEFYNLGEYNQITNYNNIFQYIIKNIDDNILKNILDVDEGLENRILKSSNINFSLDDIIKSTKSKRYTYTKIQRALLHIILNIKKDDLLVNGKIIEPMYVRILGFNKKSQHLLKLIQQNSKIPVILNLKNSINILNTKQLELLKKEIKISDIYYQGIGNNINKSFAKNFEYKKPLIII